MRHYFAGIRHDLRSVTKGFVTTIVGVLVQQGKLESVDRPVLDFFTEKDIANLDESQEGDHDPALARYGLRHRLDRASLHA